jgi:predicted CopG family antitoxin
MSQTITISDDLYQALEGKAKKQGRSIEEMLAHEYTDRVDIAKRKEVARQVEEIRKRVSAKHGVMPDSVELIRQDRER